MKEKRNIGLSLLLLAAFVLTRWPGVLPANFSATYGLVFCAGVFRRQLPWWLLLSVMAATDVGLNLFYYQTEVFSDYQAMNYLAYAAIYFLGRQFSARTSWWKLVGGGLLGALAFYFITNTAAWLQNPEYIKNIAGWLQALTVGTHGWPETWKFFNNTLLSGGLFTGLFAAALRLQEPAEPETEAEPESEEAAEAQPEQSEA